jgi:hypothetical protein
VFLGKAILSLIFVLGLLHALGLAEGAQETPAAGGSIRATGLIRTPQGVAVPGATVRLVELASGRAWLSWTGENGKFEFPGLPAGRYRIEAQQLGFEPATREIELTVESSAIELALRIAPLATPAAEGAGNARNENAASTAAGPPKRVAGEQPSAAAQSAPGPSQNAQPTPTKPARGQPPGAAPNAAELIRQRMQQRGFQQVDPTGQQGGAGPETPGQNDIGPLGEASSSDAFLISGTVGRGAIPGGDSSFGPFGQPGAFGGPGGPGEGGGFPGQPGAGGTPGGMNFPRAGGPGQPQPGGGGRGQQAQGQRGQRGGQQSRFGEGTEALWGAQRVLRQQVTRIRVSFYERYGNSALDARPYSLTDPNAAKIPTWRERFGANVGGPLRIPHVYDGREKTFFFVNYNLARTRDPVDTFATVPSLDERKGDFSARGVQLFDPCPGVAVPCSNITGPRPSFRSRIPADRLDRAALGLLEFIPLPNLPGLAQNFHLQTRVPAATDSFNMRVVHTISSKLNAQATYNFSETRTHAFQSFPQLESSQEVRGQNLMLGLTQNWTQRFINDSRVFWSRSRTSSLNNFAFVDDIGARLGINGISNDPINFGVPQISLTNFSDVNDPVPALRRNQTLRFLDSVSYALPKHTLRAGGEIRRMQVNTRTDPTPRGAFNFTGLLTSNFDANGKPVPNTGFDFADFLLGFPQSTTVRFGTSSTYFRSWGFVGYFQDDWRMHPRFTLTWGVRYEAVTPQIELYDHIANLDLNSDITAVDTVVPGQPGKFSGPLPRSLVRGDYNNWSPRLGIAWKPPLQWFNKHPMTVRAGYGIFYNTSIYNQLAATMANQPPWAFAQIRVTTGAPVLTLENGFPSVPNRITTNTAAVDPNYRAGYAQIWNFTIETQLSPNWLLETTYTGTKGTHLDLLRAPNRGGIGNATGFTYDTFGASSIYNALQVRVQHRFARGLSLQGLYTFAKSIDNASSIGGGAPVVVQDDSNFAFERGLSSFDIRHQFRLNYVYELPFGERKRWANKGWRAAALGNWTISGYTTMQTGTPYTARVLGGAVNNGGVGAGFSTRADQVGNPSQPGPVAANPNCVAPAQVQTPLSWFNPCAFRAPDGGFGNAARNTIEGPGMFQINFSLARRIPFGKDNVHRLDLRWEVSNLTNTPNFTGLSTVVNSATYGRVLGTRPMRTMDFVLRVSY